MNSKAVLASKLAAGILGVPGSTYLFTGPKSEGKFTILIYLVCSMLLFIFLLYSGKKSTSAS